jgi:GAF domain-containing protein
MSRSTNGSNRVDARTAARVALGTAVAGEPVGAMLERVARLAKETVPGVDEASVTLMKNGKPRTIAFTGPLAIHLDERQYETGFGPCLDAVVSGSLIIIPDTKAETTYKDFAAVAARQGVTHTLSMGMPIATSTIGGLNLYGTHGDPYDDDALELAGTFAGYAGIALANAAALADALDEVAGLRTAMQTRAVIEQAKGILMRDERCTADEAFRLLVRASNASNRKLHDIALSLVEGAQHRPGGWPDTE